MPLVDARGFRLTPDIAGGVSRGLQLGGQFQQQQFQREQQQREVEEQRRQQALLGQIFGGGTPVGGAPIGTPGFVPQQPVPQIEGGITPGPSGQAIPSPAVGIPSAVQPSREQLVAQLFVTNPKLATTVRKELGIRDQARSDETTKFALDLRRTPFPQRADKIKARRQELQSLGIPDDQTAELEGMNQAQQDESLLAVGISGLPIDEQVKLARGGSLTAAEQEFASLTKGMKESDVQRAKRIKLGLDPRALAKTPEVEGAIAAAKEAAKLKVQYKLKPEVAAKVEIAIGSAKATVARAGEERSNAVALNVYDTAMAGLTESLGGTVTGPVAGWLPAVTANQQIAQGAIAALAPVLKTLFRASGEGVFTDKDQELLMEMVPTRKDLPAARASKIANIDAIVRAKLSTPPSADQRKQGQEAAITQGAGGGTATPASRLQNLTDEQLQAELLQAQ